MGIWREMCGRNPTKPPRYYCVCVNGGEVIYDFTRISALRFGAVRQECNIEILTLRI